MGIRKIEIDNQIIEYQLNMKNIKKCYLKIKSGKVIVNAGFGFTIEMIENLILNHKNSKLPSIPPILLPLPKSKMQSKWISPRLHLNKDYKQYCYEFVLLSNSDNCPATE